MRKKYLSLSLCCALTMICFSQDVIRIGLGTDLVKNTFIQTFSFDLNRSEQVNEKAVRFWIYNRNNFYLQPSVDLNIGEGVNASENNVAVQANFGKRWFGGLQRPRILITNQFNKAIEINPSFTSDKNLVEKQYYGQAKLIFQNMHQRHSGTNPLTAYVERELTFAYGVFSNFGFRHSKVFSKGATYFVGGLFIDGKLRLIRPGTPPSENWIFKLSGNYYRILSELNEITTEDYAGSIKLAIDKRLYSSFYLGALYKYGNDTPGYLYMHTAEFAIKIKY